MLLWYVRTAFFAALRTLSLGLNSKQALSWFCFAHIKQQIVSLFRSDLISVCIFFNIEKILSGSALLTGITHQALGNLDKTLKLTLSVNGSLWSAISPQKVSIPDSVDGSSSSGVSWYSRNFSCNVSLSSWLIILGNLKARFKTEKENTWLVWLV